MPNPKLQSLLHAIISCVGRKTFEPFFKTWNEDTATFSIQVSAHDQGRFIGKKGIVFWALNSIFWYAGLTQINRTVGIIVLEPKDRNGERRPIPFRPNPSWNEQKITDMIEAILGACFNGSVTGWSMDVGETSAEVSIHLSEHLKAPCSDPDLSEAIKVLIHAAGMADGATIKTEVYWK